MNFFLKTALALFAITLIAGTVTVMKVAFFQEPERIIEQNRESETSNQAEESPRQNAQQQRAVREEESIPLAQKPEPKAVFEPAIEVEPVKPTPVESKIILKVKKPEVILFDVPFTAQAPFGNWSDDRQQDGCEEASALMAVRWARGLSLTLEEAEQEIIAISEFERITYGGYHDTSARDTAKRIIQGYFEYNNFEVKNTITARDIIAELKNGNLVIVPVNGRKMGNPYYTPPGPIEHQLVIIGYDKKADEFIANDPGTRRGKGFRYATSVLENALQNYLTGYKEPITTIEKNMIVIKRDK
ncbi:MAG: C39 family peptidase [Patescibacteria group bacterium]|mgnify:CR=1 FL=1